MPSSQPLRRAAFLSVLAVVASTAIVLVALAVASGAQPRPGSGTSYDTEFVDMAVLHLSWLLAPLLGVTAFFSARVALLGVAGVAISQFLAMAETVHRYDESEWSDGLQVLGYLFPIAVTACCLGSVAIGWLVGRRRPVQDQ